jgi:hypothetical protein
MAATIDILNAPPGIVPIVRGGIGNQMFVMAAGWVAATVKGCPLYILDPPPLPNKHNVHGLDYNATLFRAFETKVPPIFLLESYSRHAPEGFDPWNPAAVEPGTVLDSYYQYYPALQPFEAELRALLLRGLEGVSPDPRAAFLHVRRGDYLQLPHFHYLQSIEYYEAAVKALDALAEKALERIVIHTDDPDWVRAQPLFSSDPRFQIAAPANELEALAQMASCHGGAICANSSFSWWGAFLGAHGARAPVIVPSKKRWIAKPIAALFPDEWVELEVEAAASAT